MLFLLSMPVGQNSFISQTGKFNDLQSDLIVHILMGHSKEFVRVGSLPQMFNVT